MRPHLQTRKVLRADLKHLYRMFERAQGNTDRTPERKAEVERHFSRLVVMLTEETVDPAALSGDSPEPPKTPAPRGAPPPKNMRSPSSAGPTPNGRRRASA